MLAAIIVAAGSSRRIGFDKLSAAIAGRTVLEHSLRAFLDSPSVEQIILVVRRDNVDALSKRLAQNEKKVNVVAGGTERQNSVEAGIAALKPAASFVAVHDAARPLITPAQIESVYAAAREHGAASLAEPVADTLKRADAVGFVTESVDRRSVYAMQTPQVFARNLLQEAYAAVGASKTLVTDEVSAVELLGRRVALVQPNDCNFKVTYPRDLELAEMILKARAAKK